MHWVRLWSVDGVYSLFMFCLAVVVIAFWRRYHDAWARAWAAVAASALALQAFGTATGTLPTRVCNSITGGILAWTAFVVHVRLKRGRRA